jgi:hypothetical protein
LINKTARDSKNVGELVNISYVLMKQKLTANMSVIILIIPPSRVFLLFCIRDVYVYDRVVCDVNIFAC